MSIDLHDLNVIADAHIWSFLTILAICISSIATSLWVINNDH